MHAAPVTANALNLPVVINSVTVGTAGCQVCPKHWRGSRECELHAAVEASRRPLCLLLSQPLARLSPTAADALLCAGHCLCCRPATNCAPPLPLQAAGNVNPDAKRVAGSARQVRCSQALRMPLTQIPRLGNCVQKRCICQRAIASHFLLGSGRRHS